ncbi:unnamed protein product [Rotaria sp. Silwood2]|nr:unnamed protein product [Rotaria sp. Silwood2]CAF3058115.1 unnamed protein product [Rotaria sp. Silwood2]CAF3376176.1 unnamed protein product [Rotaria sp. Silwood2]CAF4224839.1 unnamed protein product [Rotaria sp. Silwood2]CAF4279116.1 unnamed protein product [Rotaria sp. Silwood2]
MELPLTATTEKSKNSIEEGRLKASKGDYLGAIASFNKVTPVTFHSLYYRGCAHLELGGRIEIYKAIEDFNQALKISQVGIDSNIYYKRAIACELIGQYAEAIIDYTMYIKQCQPSDKHKGYLSRGLVYSEIQQLNKALEDINHANKEVRQPPIYYRYCLTRAEASLKKDEEAKIIIDDFAKFCREECDKSPQTFQTYFYYGLALYELNNYNTALQQFNEALKQTSNERERLDTIFYIGLTQDALDQKELAKENLRSVLNIDKNYTRALFRLGIMDSENDDLQTEALNNLTKAHEQTPHKSDILYVRGKVYYKMGQIRACVNDKRLAFQLENANIDSATMKHYFEVR